MSLPVCSLYNMLKQGMEEGRRSLDRFEKDICMPFLKIVH